MKKVASVLAVVVLSIGLFSCEADNNAAENDTLFEDAMGNTQTVDDEGRN